MAGNDSALREKVLGGNHARRQRLRLRGLCVGRGLGRREGLLRPKRGAEGQMDEKTCGQRGARQDGKDPRGAAWPHKRKTVGLACPLRTDRTINDRIEHWLRGAHPESDFRFPFGKNLPMRISAKSIR
jgi:hypothetical protein